MTKCSKRARLHASPATRPPTRTADDADVRSCYHLRRGHGEGMRRVQFHEKMRISAPGPCGATEHARTSMSPQHNACARGGATRAHTGGGVQQTEGEIHGQRHNATNTHAPVSRSRRAASPSTRRHGVRKPSMRCCEGERCHQGKLYKRATRTSNAPKKRLQNSR